MSDEGTVAGTIRLTIDGREVEVPAGWSQVASDVLAQKYFRKAGVPKKLNNPVSKNAG